VIQEDRLHWTGRRRAQHTLAVYVIGVRIIHERLLAAELEDLRRERDTLCVPQAFVEINDDAHWETLPVALTKRKWYYSW
jgi:hypothetical protein